MKGGVPKKCGGKVQEKPKPISDGKINIARGCLLYTSDAADE